MSASVFSRCLVVFLALGIGAISDLCAAGRPGGNTASHKVTLRIEEIAVIGLEDTSPLELAAARASADGIKTLLTGTGIKVLNYTTVNRPGMTRSITVQWGASSEAPPGTSLRILAVYVPPGCGMSAPEVAVGTTPQPVIVGIPSCATGLHQQGAILRYLLTVDDGAALQGSSESAVTVIFMISEL